MRLLYSFLVYLLTPLMFAWLGRRALTDPAYRSGWGQRLGFYQRPIPGQCIWVHAASMGEVQAAIPLLKALRERYPNRPLLVTTTTPTGRDRLLQSLGENVIHLYAPLDMPGAVRRFFAHVRPSIGLVMEVELWPNLLLEAKNRDIPLLLLNARMSSRSLGRYRRLGRLLMRVLGAFRCIAAQSNDDAERFSLLAEGAVDVRVVGNLKYDQPLPQGVPQLARDLRKEAGQRPVWIAGSTREGEDELVLRAFAMVRRDLPDCLLILVPRHPDRFKTVAALCEKAGFRLARRSDPEVMSVNAADILLGDTMGELSQLYAAADVAFVGGTLVPVGGHNLLEPAALSLPVLTGPHYFNAPETAEALLAADAALRVEGSEGLAAAITALLEDPVRRQGMGQRGRALIEQNQGAIERTLTLVDETMR